MIDLANPRIQTRPQAIEQLKARAIAAVEQQDHDTAINCTTILTLSAGTLNTVRPQLARFTWTWLTWFLDTYYPDIEPVS